MVKADAYGHGAARVAAALRDAGCERLAVLTVAEAAELRDAGSELPLLVLGGLHDSDEAEAALRLETTPVLHHAGQVALAASAAQRVGTPLAVHVEVDTGMRRMGVAPEAAAALLEKIRGERALRLEGVLTQLARADEPDLAPSLEQLATFSRVLRDAEAGGAARPFVHVWNSAGLLALPDLAGALADDVGARPGLMLYGVSPAPHLRASLRPVMTLRTRVVALRPVAPGDAVGYGGTWRAPRRGRIATLALGYDDGVPCAAGNRGSALLHGRRVPIAGRISMDFVTLDVGDGPAAIGDEVILFGKGPQGRLPVEEAAAAADTIPYELLVRVGRRVPRRYVERG